MCLGAGHRTAGRRASSDFTPFLTKGCRQSSNSPASTRLITWPNLPIFVARAVAHDIQQNEQLSLFQLQTTSWPQREVNKPSQYSYLSHTIGVREGNNFWNTQLREAVLSRNLCTHEIRSRPLSSTPSLIVNPPKGVSDKCQITKSRKGSFGLFFLLSEPSSV